MDNLTPEQRHMNMQRIRSTHTEPEMILMRELRCRKIYFASHVKTLPGKPDIVFRRKKIAVFVDSEFWHHHPKKFTMPSSNREYWEPKIAANVARDRKHGRTLRRMGWVVVRVWEADVRKNLPRVMNRIIKCLENR